MKLTIFINLGFFINFHAGHIIQAADVPPQPPIRARNLILLMDPNENETLNSPNSERALTTALVNALIQKNAPLVISPSLWNNFIERRKRLANLVSQTPFHTDASTAIAILNSVGGNVIDFLYYSVPFVPQEWIIKKIPNVACILVPTAYVDKINLGAGSFIDNIPLINKEETLFKRYKKNNIAGNLTIDELLLGLKIDLWPDIDPNSPIVITESQIDAIKNFDWTELFVTRKDLDIQVPIDPKKPLMEAPKPQSTADIKKEHEKYLKQLTEQQKNNDPLEFYLWPWQIYMMGHGSSSKMPDDILEILGMLPTDTVAGLSIESFLKFINFLNFSIKTEFFFYATCFGGGQHTDPIFQYVYEIQTKNVLKKVPYNLNFTIATGAITDQSTIAPALTIDSRGKFDRAIDIVVDQAPLSFKIYADFPAFFYELENYFTNQKNKKTLANIIDLVHKFTDFDSNPTHIVNIPLIRLPNTEWFKAIDVHESVDIIDNKTLMQYLSQNFKTFEIEKYALLLYEPYIPLPIIFKNNKAKIIPMNTKEFSYFFETIEKNGVDLADIFKSFIPFKKIPYPVTFYARNFKITIESNDGIQGALGNPDYAEKMITLTNVKISQNLSSITISFLFEGDFYDEKLDSYEFDRTFSSLCYIKPKNVDQASYVEKFNTETESLKKQFKQLESQIQNITKIQQQKIKKGPRPVSLVEQITIPLKNLIHSSYNGESPATIEKYLSQVKDPNEYLAPHQHKIKSQLMPLNPLTAAIMGNAYDAMKLLLPKIDVNANNNALKLSPLHYAALSSNIKAAQLLLDNHANIDAQNVDGNTPLKLAIQIGSEQLVKLFLKYSDEHNIPAQQENDGELIERLQKLTSALQGLTNAIH